MHTQRFPIFYIISSLPTKMASMAIASMWASMAAWFTPSVLFCAANIIIATIFIASSNHNKHHDHLQDQAHHPPTRISRVSSFLDRARSFKLSPYSVAESQYQYPPESKTATYSSSSRLAQSIHLSTNNNELYPSEPETQPLSPPAHAPSLFQRVKSIKLSSVYNEMNSVPASDSPGQLTRAPSFLDRVRSFRISSVSTQPETVYPDPDPNHNTEHNVIRSKSDKTPKKKSSVEMKKSRSEMKIAKSDDEDDDVDVRRPATARVKGSNDVDEEVDAKADDFISRFKQQLKLQRLESLVRYNQMLNRRS